ncbi:TonB-dependent receptor [Granulicella arctica]|uniref:TonB-dependent receptor n=1 Tax=Granulicella arctica TaxID=940613 RepID=UPI0021DFB1DA|nr:carboxypeptidase regulatory-like domain-containing protein [Granulicella arctica]
MHSQKLVSTLVIAFVLAMSGTHFFGQAVTATLVGTISDSAKAGVANARVTITEQQTGATITQPANESGNYQFSFLTPGIYSVSATGDGFQTKVTRDVSVPVNTTARVDVTLQPGSVTQTVTVTDQAPLLQTDRGDVSAQIEAEQVNELPLGSDRNFQSLEALVPGVSPAFYDHSTFFDAQNSQAFKVNGQSELANNTQLEGVDDNQRGGLLQVYIPPAAAIQTVDVETSNYAPEFGRSAGAVTNVTLKSGTNGYHGSAFEYNSVSKTSARSYFNNTGVFPRFTNNYFGGTIGGPIRKDKLFFFADFLRYANDSSQYQLWTVPTASFRAGDFRASTTKIYDPQTGKADGTGRSQFTSNGVANVIPTGRLNPLAQKLIALVPLPNIPGAGFTNNFQEDAGFRVKSNGFDIKVDQNLRKADHFTARFSYQNVNTQQDPSFGLAGGPGGGGGYEGTATDLIWVAAGEYTHVFSPTFFTEARLGVNYFNNVETPTDYGSTATTDLGIPGINTNQVNSGLVGINITGYSQPLLGYTPFVPSTNPETNIDVVNNWTKILGNHSIVFGGEARVVRDDVTEGQTYGTRGVFTYSTGQTSLNISNASTAASIGNDFASFILDLPSQVGIDVNVGDASWREKLYFGFGQDTWQATSKLTLTYGLRWEFYPPATPKQKGGFSQYDPTTNSLLVAGYGDIPLNLGVQTNAKNFEPRMGFAYRISPSSVLRGGFGISHTPFQYKDYAYNYPVKQNQVFNPVNSFFPALNNSSQPATLAAGFAPAPEAVIPSTGIIPNAPISSSYISVDTNYRDPYIMSFNLTMEQNLGHKWVANVAYVGNLGRHVPGNYNLNAATVAGLGAKGQPEFATFGRTATTELLPKGTNSAYNSLQARVTHRYANGLVWTSAFAWQKALGFNSNQNNLGGYLFYLDPKRDYAPVNWDTRLTYSQSFVYELPLGKNKAYLKTGLVSKVVGGWQVSSLLNSQTGLPLLFTASASVLNAPGNTQVPNQVGAFHKIKSIGPGHPWFDTSAFTQPVGPVLGNMGKNVYSGPGQITFNSALARSFPIRDSVQLQFRLDSFNVLNHPNFSNPSTDMTSSSFGQVTAIASSGASAAGNASGPRTLELAATLKF